MNRPFDPLQFLQLANEIGRQGGEPKLRAAVGRAYYALFLVARDKTGVRDRRGVHQKVISAVKKRRGFRTTGDQLAKLKRLRGVADYDMLPPDPNERDWLQNWSQVRTLAPRVLSKLKTW